MRTIRVTWEQKVSDRGSLLVETEVIVDADDEAEEAGREAFHVLLDVMDGAQKAAAEA